MSFFEDNDPFEDIVREFFGETKRRKYEPSSGEEDDRIIDFIETRDRVFFVFELPGFNEEEINVNIREKKIIITAKKKNHENVPDYLSKKLARGITLSRTLPYMPDSKKVEKTFKNGILEVSFKR